MARNKEIHKFKVGKYKIEVYFSQSAFYRNIDPEIKKQLRKMYGHKYTKPLSIITPEHNEGIADLDTNTVQLLICRYTGMAGISKLVAHEIGHLIKETHMQNPPYDKAHIKEHEEKANHYEKFNDLVWKITSKIYYCSWE